MGIKKQQTKPTKSAKPTDKKDMLEEQILALGGTFGDVKFLEQIDLDKGDELITSTEADDKTESLQAELSAFLRNIGLSSKVASKHVEVDDLPEEEEPEASDDQAYAEEAQDDAMEASEDNDSNHDSDEPDEDTFKIKSASASNLLVEPTPQWYNAKVEVLGQTTKPALSAAAVAAKLTEARALLDKENEQAGRHEALSSSDRKFMANIMQSGTLNDKVSALTLLIQESPLHGLKPLDTLIGMSKKKGRKEANMAVQSLKDLFVGSALPDRKLVYFAEQPLHHPNVTDTHLLLWAFEDFLKKYYFDFIQQVETLSHDTLLHIRYNMVTCLYDLLAGKPEQEQNLLKLLVNKLGDSENKVAAKASQKLIELLVQHPGMKMYVVREIEQLILQPKSSPRSQYYAMVTLNQTILTAKDAAVANKLIELYFTFFRRLMQLADHNDETQTADDDKEATTSVITQKKKSRKQLNREKEAARKQQESDEHQNKMVGAILTGVNRAFHFSTLSDETFEKHMQTLFKITHAGTFNTAIQALSLIFSISLTKQTQSDRFYRTMYESMLDPRLLTTSKQAMYLNLLFKAMRADEDKRRVKSFIKRTVQIAGLHQPSFVCGLLYILSQIMHQQPGLRSMLTTPEENDEEQFVDAPEDDDEDVKPTAEPQQPTLTLYDGRKRDPRFSNAEGSCLWELLPLKHHYHPSVVKYTEALFQGELIQDNPDLHLHTLMHFLDRFVYRNAKKQTTTKGSSIMQPMANRRDGGVLQTKGSLVSGAPVNSEEFWRQQIDKVPVDEIFFHKYFTQKHAGVVPKTQDKTDDEDEIWRAMMASVPGGLEEDDLANVDEDDEEDDEEMRALLMEEDDEDEDQESQDDSEDEVEAMSDDDEDDDGEDGGFLGSAMPASSDDDDEADVKRTLDDEETQLPKKKRKVQLPTFASMDDYAHLLEEEDDGLA
ncbi:CBF-domain-containing protein [Hesseltinella vesiculosa]|uniref:CBF-domain-containing protein n=1 Tax=Hesseltinella vesiculosa TaxID=101127 RepID=A0A1X2G3W7_9FUNG|nr:CBF-domain-containing protein [Hesseltinella vesiculosa]